MCHSILRRVMAKMAWSIFGHGLQQLSSFCFLWYVHENLMFRLDRLICIRLTNSITCNNYQGFIIFQLLCHLTYWQDNSSTRLFWTFGVGYCLVRPLHQLWGCCCSAHEHHDEFVGIHTGMTRFTSKMAKALCG